MADTDRGVVGAAAGMRMAFQPIVDLASGKVVGHEALARFADNRPPDQWFAAAHEMDLGVDLEILALSRALGALPFEAAGFISLNLSPAALVSPVLEHVLKASAAEIQIVLELTEHMPIPDYVPLQCVMFRLRELGILLAVDDLGSGFASLRHVLHLRPDMVKLDRSLVAGIDRDPVQCRLAAGLIDFATSIDCDVIAEGIERVEEQATCLDIGIRLGQGYLFGRPEVPPQRAAVGRRIILN